MKVGKVRVVKPQTIGIAAVTPNHYTTCRMAFSWQSDLLLGITSSHATRRNLWLLCWHNILADLLLPEYRR